MEEESGAHRVPWVMTPLCNAQVLPTLHYGLNEMGALRGFVQSSTISDFYFGGGGWEGKPKTW